MPHDILRSFQVYGANDEILAVAAATVREAVKKAKSSGEVQQVLLSRKTHRENVEIGDIYVVPVAALTSLEKFPYLILNTVMRNHATAEGLAEFKCSAAYDDGGGLKYQDELTVEDLKALKQEILGDSDEPLLVFAAAWAHPSSYVTFPFRDKSLVADLRYSAYATAWNPALSSAMSQMKAILPDIVPMVRILPKGEWLFELDPNKGGTEYPVLLGGLDLAEAEKGSRTASRPYGRGIRLMAAEIPALETGLLDDKEVEFMASLDHQIGDAVTAAAEDGLRPAHAPTTPEERLSSHTASKTAGFSYALAPLTLSFVEKKTGVPFNRDTMDRIMQTYLPVKSSDGEGDAAPRIVGHRGSGSLTRLEEQEGKRRETIVDLTVPKGYEAKFYNELNRAFAQDFAVTSVPSGTKPETKQGPVPKQKPMPGLSGRKRNPLLGAMEEHGLTARPDYGSADSLEARSPEQVDGPDPKKAAFGLGKTVDHTLMEAVSKFVQNFGGEYLKMNDLKRKLGEFTDRVRDAIAYMMEEKLLKSYGDSVQILNRDMGGAGGFGEPVEAAAESRWNVLAVGKKPGEPISPRGEFPVKTKAEALAKAKELMKDETIYHIEIEGPDVETYIDRNKKGVWEKTHYGNKEASSRVAKAPAFADPENEKYKLSNEEEIRAAWSYIHMPKNRKKYDAAKLKTMEGHIISAWKEKIDKAGPPEAAKAASARYAEAGDAQGPFVLTDLVGKFGYLDEGANHADMGKVRPDEIADPDYVTQFPDEASAQQAARQLRGVHVVPLSRYTKRFSVSKTYEIHTEESRAEGDAAERGFEFENQPYTLDQLVSELSDGGYVHLSSTLVDGRTWASTEGTEDFQTGEDTVYSLFIKNEDGSMLSSEEMEEIYGMAGLVKGRTASKKASRTASTNALSLAFTPGEGYVLQNMDGEVYAAPAASGVFFGGDWTEDLKEATVFHSYQQAQDLFEMMNMQHQGVVIHKLASKVMADLASGSFEMNDLQSTSESGQSAPQSGSCQSDDGFTPNDDCTPQADGKMGYPALGSLKKANGRPTPAGEVRVGDSLVDKDGGTARVVGLVRSEKDPDTISLMLRTDSKGTQFTHSVKKDKTLNVRTAGSFYNPSSVIENFYPELLGDDISSPYREQTQGPTINPFGAPGNEGGMSGLSGRADGLNTSYEGVPLRTELNYHGPEYARQFYAPHADIPANYLTPKKRAASKTASMGDITREEWTQMTAAGLTVDSPRRKVLPGVAGLVASVAVKADEVPFQDPIEFNPEPGEAVAGPNPAMLKIQEFLLGLVGAYAAQLIQAFQVVSRPIVLDQPYEDTIDLMESLNFAAGPMPAQAAVKAAQMQFQEGYNSLSVDERQQVLDSLSAQAAVWHSPTDGSGMGFKYEVYVRGDELTETTLKVSVVTAKV